MRATLLVFLNKHSQSWDICLPNISYANLFLKYQKFLVTLPNILYRVTGNSNHTIICLGLICMYLLPHVCITICLIYLLCETKLDSLLTWKIPRPPPPPPLPTHTFSLTNWLVCDKENNSLWKDISFHSGTLMADFCFYSLMLHA
jgi:hypothetical protein